jgi:signal transduction histidine kinase
MRGSLVRRLMLAYTTVIAAVLLSAWWSQRSLGEAERAAAHLSERSIQGLELSARLETLIEEKNHVADYVLSEDHEALIAIRPHRQEFAAWMATMEDFVRTDRERALLDRLRAEYAEYTSVFDELIRHQRSGDTSEARTLFAALTGHVQRLLIDGRQLAQLAEQDMAARRAQADAAIEDARSVVLWLTGLGGLLSLVLGFVLSRYAAGPIYQLVLRLGSSGAIDRVEVAGDELGALETHVGALLARVRQQERALQQAEKLSEMGEIASEIAHETLNPLAGVKGMLQALRRTSLPADRLSRELADMERELDRIEGIVRRLVRYARPLEPRMQPVLVERTLEDAAEIARRAPGACGRTISVRAPRGDLQWVMDPDLIQQVLVNLLVNGCEASPEGTTVEIHAAIASDRLTFWVRDRGHGIAAIDRDRLFHPFFTTKPNGNGLGLAVSRNIVREHGGHIEAAAAEEGGSVFTVVLPDGGELCTARS